MFKTRKKRAVLICLALLVVAGAIAFQGYRWKLKRDLNQYRAELVAKGERLSLDEILRDRKPPASNSVEHFRAALTILTPETVASTNPPTAMQMATNGEAIVAWKLPTILQGDWATNSLEEFETALEAQTAALDHLHSIIEKPVLDFNLDLREGALTPVPHLADLKHFAQLLTGAALLELRKGNPHAAVEHIRAVLAMAKGLEEESLVISQLVRETMTRIAIGAVWELLQSPVVDDSDLHQIQKDLSALAFVLPMERAIEMDRAIDCHTMKQLKSPGVIYGALTEQGMATSSEWPASETLLATVKRYLSLGHIKENVWEITWRSSLAYVDEKRYLEGMQALIEAARSMVTADAKASVLTNLDAEFARLGMAWNRRSSMLLMCAPDSLGEIRRWVVGAGVSEANSLWRVIKVEAVRQLAVSAVALKRYHLAHGRFPSEPGELVPEFLEAVPLDPIDGQPLRYRLLDNGNFILYSVGEDGKDDGGDSTSQKPGSFHLQNGRDWVWPRPASEEEVAAYFERRTD